MSTPIENIPQDVNLEDDAELVEELLQEAGQNSQQYAPPAQQYQPQYPEMVPQRQQPTFYNPYHDQVPPQNYQPVNQPQVANGPVQAPSLPPPSHAFMQRVIAEVKAPLLLMTLYVLFSMPFVDRTVGRLVPRLATEAGTMSFLGIVMKSIVLAILFYIFLKIVK